MNNPVVNDPEMFTLEDVLDEKDARGAARKASTVGALAEQEYVRATGALATAEREYRQALAAEVVRLHSTGVAWTVCSDLARGDTKVSELRHARDIAKGMVDVGRQRGFRLAADRRSLDALTEWSMKQSLAFGPSAGEPADTVPIGSRRAA